MIHNIYKMLGLCLIIFLASCKQEGAKLEDSFELEGEVSGLTNGTAVQLVPGATHSNEKPIAETTVKDGRFNFTGSLDQPRFFYVVFGDNQGFVPVMLENSKIKFTASAKMDNTEGKRINVTNIQIEGSEAHDYYKEKTAFKKELEDEYDAMRKSTENMSNLLGNARKNGNKKVLDSLMGTSAYKEMEKVENAFFDKVKSTSQKLISDHGDSWWGPFFMMHQYTYLTPDEAPIYDAFSEEAKNSLYGKLVHESVYPKGFIGEKVSNHSLKDKDGESFDTQNIISGKKYVLIDFWASWCAPCRKEIPNLKNAYAEFSGKGFEILSVSIDKNQDAWIKALGQENMGWPNLLDNGDLSKEFNVKTIPATYLVDGNGVVIAENLRGKELDEKLAELLN
ncbi:TlpA disulfide reductase family protein [Flagellimonas baculiformis]|uniref:TlpA disulfide reductase family protein n=1 Tax=Flagellimonas baculiformis TaxID=3067310 RepID=UPI00296EBA65|nr:TlpA disulfide reductase family protein [Muricauda sp. D6]